jgi:hypothetical protein
MKRKSASRAALFNSRLLIGFALSSVGLLLALAGLSKSVTGSAPDLNGHCGVNNNNHLTGYCLGSTGAPTCSPRCWFGYDATACPVGAIAESPGTITCYIYSLGCHFDTLHVDFARPCTVGGTPTPTPTPTVTPTATQTPIGRPTPTPRPRPTPHPRPTP